MDGLEILQKIINMRSDKEPFNLTFKKDKYIISLGKRQFSTYLITPEHLIDALVFFKSNK